MDRMSRRMGWFVRVSVVLGLVAGLAMSLLALAGQGQPKDTTMYERIYAEVIPAAGAETSYGIPLSLENLLQFIGWKDTIVLSPVEERVFHDALVQIPAPCCDDNTAFQCCCEKGGRRCNIVTSAKGLAAYLVHEKGYTGDQVRDTVLEWLRFARPDYYVAQALEAEGLNPATYGVTTEGSCYRGMCEVPISQGGCGGMGKLIEPTIEEKKG